MLILAHQSTNRCVYLPLLVVCVLFCSCSRKDNGPILADNEAENKQPEPKSNDGYPYENRFEFGVFPQDLDWVNTDGRVRMEDLRGKYVIVDFWTSCCLNCFHVLAELDKVKDKYPGEVVVVGIHAGKFTNEKDSQNVLEAIERYGISHPVANDADHRYAKKMAIIFWPTVFIVTPDGQLVMIVRNEITSERMSEIIDQGIGYFREKGQIDKTPLHLKVAKATDAKTPLRFPGEVLADEDTNRLFIADSGHNRIIICTLSGELIDVVGCGKVGSNDGSYETATFHFPHGMALHENNLFVADSRNHLIRAINLQTRKVSTVAGTGNIADSNNPFPQQDGYKRWTGDPLKTDLKSPWSLLVHSKDLYIAMAGSHQIWHMPLDGSFIGPFAGNGREDVVDDVYLPSAPFELDAASFGQPMGITRSFQTMYVADAEGNSIRQVPLRMGGKVQTLLGTDHMPDGRLFNYGDVNGGYKIAKFQHPRDVEFFVDRIFVADTFNNKIKVITGGIDSLARENCKLEDFVGTGAAGNSDEPGAEMFNEPGGISATGSQLFVADTNNHSVRVIDIFNRKTSTLATPGLKPPVIELETRPDFADATQIVVEPIALGSKKRDLRFDVQLQLSEFIKLNELASNGCFIDFLDENKNVIERGDFKSVDAVSGQVTFDVNSIPDSTKFVRISMVYYFCLEGGEGICRIGSAVWNVPLVQADSQHPQTTEAIQLQHAVE